MEDYYQLDYKRRKSPTKRQCPLPKKLPKVVLQDPDDPQIEIQSLTMQVKSLKTQVKSLKQKVRRRNKKVKTLKSLMDNLKEKQLYIIYWIYIHSYIGSIGSIGMETSKR